MERADVLGMLAERRELNDEIVTGLREATEAFKQTFTA
jgi:hypothetical protein